MYNINCYKKIYCNFCFSPFRSGRPISGGEFSSDGSPVSTPGHSPYSSCTNLANIDDDFAGFYESNGKKQNTNSSSENNSESSVILNVDSDTNRKNSHEIRTGNLILGNDTLSKVQTLGNESLSAITNNRPNSALNPTVRCEILMQKGTYLDIKQKDYGIRASKTQPIS